MVMDDRLSEEERRSPTTPEDNLFDGGGVGTLWKLGLEEGGLG